ncbi:heme-binding domain-containing protein [Arcticibacter eurypsychrophilus]|uniref:heme-binding domain-containing protein n=1 Tax=Arcticibacter eurypsychrophilus TaxID=1434752 RepID=UPI00084D8598|nr:heme-binding domain-containing protein [Arcticibacter eurypsychrophilus]
MSIRKKVLLSVLAVLLLIQFFQPKRNVNTKASKSDINNVYQVPDKVKAVLQRSCYDCHSNSTNYPWYSSIQPFGWVMASHIRKGKSELDFNRFGEYSPRRQKSKLKSIRESIKDNSMPLPSYTLIHQSAKLSNEQKNSIYKWLDNVQSTSLQ